MVVFDGVAFDAELRILLNDSHFTFTDEDIQGVVDSARIAGAADLMIRSTFSRGTERYGFDFEIRRRTRDPSWAGCQRRRIILSRAAGFDRHRSM